MQRLNRGMMRRYDIPERRPERVNAVQFGMDETMLGIVDRRIDDVAPGIGIACVAAGEAAAAKALRAQDGMYTLLVRGYEGESPVRREQVVQRIAEVIDPEEDFGALTSLALRPELALGLANTEGPAAELALTLAARLLAARFREGLPGLDFLCAGDTADCARRAAAFIGRVGAGWGLGADFAAWLGGENRFYPMLADSLAFRAAPEEAAKVCADMNYADDLLHIAEPFARLTVGAPQALAARWGLEGPGIAFAEDLDPALALKHRVFDGVLCALAAPGWLLGCDTLADCMKHERLRAFVGNAVVRELLPALPVSREAAAAAVIETFGRLENPLNDNRVLPSAHHLLRRFEVGALPAIRAWAEEHFDAPESLSFALAATIMLYAGARRAGDAGRYEVQRGKLTEALPDDPARLAVFGALSHDMPPEALAYAALADRELWRGLDLREIDGLESRVTLALAALQRDPSWLPEGE